MYYPYVKSCLADIEGKNGFYFSSFSALIRCCYLKMNNISSDKREVFNHMIKWFMEKTGSASVEACEIVVSFFIQNCEIPK